MPAGSRLAPPRRSAYAEPEGDNADADNEVSAQSTAQLAQAVHQNKSATVHGSGGSMQGNHQLGKALHLSYHNCPAGFSAYGNDVTMGHCGLSTVC